MIKLPTQNFKVGEMLNKRTLNSKTWMNFDGSYTTEIHAGLVHYEDENGNLQNINTDLYDEADFDQVDFPVAKDGDSLFYEVKSEVIEAKRKNRLNRDNFDFQGLKVPFDCRIPRNIRKGYSIGKGASKLKFVPVGASTSHGFVEGNKITYPNVWADTDIVLEVLPIGIKETIILKTDKAPFDFSFEVDGELANELQIQPPWLVDAEGTQRDVVQGVSEVDGKVILSLAADVSALVYPIEIDPTVVIQPSIGEDVYFDSSNYATSDRLLIGDYGSTREVLIKFNMGDLSNSHVTSAILSLYCIDLVGNFGFSIQARHVTSIWDYRTVTSAIKPNVENNPVGNSVRPSFYDWANFDILTSVRRWANGESNHGISLKKNALDVDGQATFSSSRSTTNKPKLTITYNKTPTTPRVISPNGNELWYENHTVSWQASIDVENDPIIYEAQLTTNNGSTWKTIKSGFSGTSFEHNFRNEQESSLARIRVRAFDGTSYSPWDMSDGVFTIQHNISPTMPTNLQPSGGQSIDRSKNVRLSWQHHDVNTNDHQSKFDLQWRLQGSTTWNTVTQVTTNQFYDISGLPRGMIEWQVRTYDQADLRSPYSDIAIFMAGDKPTKPIIISPFDGEVIPIANPTIQWSSSEQVGYHLKVLELNNIVLWESIVTSTNKAVTIPYSISNNINIKISLAVKNTDGLFSDAVTVSLSVSYTPPPLPDIEVLKGDSYIQINILDQDPVGTQPSIAYHEIFKEIESEFVKIATNVGSQYKDYHVSSGQQERYFVRTVGDNGTFVDTITFTQSVSTFAGVWLHLVEDPENTIYQFKYDGDGRSSNWALENAVHHFQGRRAPVIETGDMEEYSVDFNLKIISTEERQALERIVYSGQTVCYRDGRGRKVFGVIVNVPLGDEVAKMYSTSLSLMKIDFKEGIE